MTKIFTKLSLCALAMVLSGITYSQNIPELLYYNFDGTGINVPNLASAPPAGTTTAALMGGVTQGGSNICQGTLIGTGNSSNTDYLNTNWAPNLSSPWTVSFRTSNIGASSTLFYMFGDINAGQFRCFTNGVAGPNNWILRGPFTDVVAYGGAVTAPTMTTFVYDYVTNDIRAYVNGVLVNTVPQSGIAISGVGPFKVGGYSTNVGLPAGGNLDEFRFYSRALSAAEVAELYNPFATGGFLGADQNICPSTPITIDLPWPATTVAWSNGGMADTTIVSSAGQLSVAIAGTCGSGADTIVLNSLATSATTTLAACDLYTAPSGATHTLSGTFIDTIPNSLGCDSLITVNLIVNNSSTSTLTTLSCGPFTAPSGTVFNANGTFTDVIPNATGCDSIITINLTVGADNSSTITADVCGQYIAPSGTVHTTSATFTDIIPNASGCDSVITIDLTVNQMPVATITQNGLTLTASSAFTYQWINCSTSQGLPNGSSPTFTVTENGQYAVILSNENCVDTSSCITIANVSIDEALTSLTSVYPNPTTGKFMVQLPFEQQNAYVQVVDGMGKIIMTRQMQNASLISLDLEAEAGLYYVQITMDSGQKITKKILKK